MNRPTLEEVMKGMTSFIVKVFVICGLLGLAAALGYYTFSHSPEKVFHSIVIFAAVAYTCPMFGVSMRLMIRMYYMGCEAQFNTDKIIEGYERAQATLAPMTEHLKTIIEQAPPIVADIRTIVEKAKGMADDVERIAHKVRSTADSLNGHLDFKNLGEKLDKVGDNLATIAQAFGGGSSEMPEIDLLAPKGKKR